MKRTILILVILTVGIVHSQAQIGKYYRTVFNTYQQDIIETDSVTIVTENDGLMSWYLFQEGICTEIYYTIEGLTEEVLRKVMLSNERLTKSKKGDWWYYSVLASNGKEYPAITEIYHDKEGRVFHHLYINSDL